MLPERRQELLRRRGELLERLRQRQAAESLQRVIQPLEEAGVRYTLAEDEAALTWVRRHFPIVDWGRIDWPNVPGCVCVEEDQLPSPAAWLTEVGAQVGLKDPEVTVLYANRPTLTLRFSELIRHLDDVIDWGWETWIFDPGDTWIIEHFHEGEWCWGRSPSRL